MDLSGTLLYAFISVGTFIFYPYQRVILIVGSYESDIARITIYHVNDCKKDSENYCVPSINVLLFV